MGRWIRVSVAHHYLAVDRRWFDQHIRPGLTLIKISKQARAFIRAEIDEAAQRVEDSLRDGRPSSEERSNSMGRTRTSGIVTDAEGNKIVSKQVQGKAIYARLGAVRQIEAERAACRPNCAD